MIQRELEVPRAGGILRKIGGFLPQESVDASSPPQIAQTQETSTASLTQQINNELDLFKLGCPRHPVNLETGFSYFDLYVSARQLNGISAETQTSLGFNGEGGEVKITYVYDNMGIARKISLRKKSRAAAFLIENGPAHPNSHLHINKRKEAVMSAADALLVARLGRKLVRV